MTNRIPIESDLWLRDLSSDMDDPRPELIQLMKEANPTSEQIEWFLDGLYYVDYPTPQFLLCIPYLLDMFEQDRSNLVPAIRQFCRFMHKCKDGKPSEDHLQQFEQSKERIFDLLVACLKDSMPIGYDLCKELLAGIGTACGESDLGRQIVDLDPITPIN